MADWQRARIIPVSGIDTAKEAEARATSALLATLSVVRDLSSAVLSPFGASTAKAAEVDCFIEPAFEVKKKTVRPDGLIRVTYGRREWTALIEIKTGKDSLNSDQINEYWDVARRERLNCVITISNELPSVPGAHPTDGLRVQMRSPVQVHHVSWTWLLAIAVNIKTHKGVEDPEQAWILNELIRYLEHPKSGALSFDDMGPNWVEVRKAARENRLSPRDEGAVDIAQRWDQLLRHLALTLGSDIGEDVQQVLSRKHARDPHTLAPRISSSDWSRMAALTEHCVFRTPPGTSASWPTSELRPSPCRSRSTGPMTEAVERAGPGCASSFRTPLTICTSMRTRRMPAQRSMRRLTSSARTGEQSSVANAGNLCDLPSR